MCCLNFELYMGSLSRLYLSDSRSLCHDYHRNNITLVIDRNKRGNTGKEYNKKEHLNEDGVPVCTAGHPIIYHGYAFGRWRKKFRCSLAIRKIASCPFQDPCSTSSYGRAVYVADGGDAGPLVYRSDKWKQIYKNRTSTERINNHVLNNYNLHSMCIRNNKAKFAFFAIMVAINIHLDSWINVE